MRLIDLKTASPDFAAMRIIKFYGVWGQRALVILQKPDGKQLLAATLNCQTWIARPLTKYVRNRIGWFRPHSQYEISLFGHGTLTGRSSSAERHESNGPKSGKRHPDSEYVSFFAAGELHHGYHAEVSFKRDRMSLYFSADLRRQWYTEAIEAWLPRYPTLLEVCNSEHRLRAMKEHSFESLRVTTSAIPTVPDITALRHPPLESPPVVCADARRSNRVYLAVWSWRPDEQAWMLTYFRQNEFLSPENFHDLTNASSVTDFMARAATLAEWRAAEDIVTERWAGQLPDFYHEAIAGLSIPV